MMQHDHSSNAINIVFLKYSVRSYNVSKVMWNGQENVIISDHDQYLADVIIRFFGPLNTYMYSCKKLDGFVWKLENLVIQRKKNWYDSSIQKDIGMV